MDFPQFLRLFYQPLSPKADCESAKNLYLEKIESGNGRGPLAMMRSPGLKIFSGDVPVILTSCPIRGVQVGVAFSKFLLASGGTAPYTWAITSGSLPNGITLNAATGELAGTATESGTFPFTASITDADHIVGIKTCFVISTTIGITSGCPVAQPAIGVPYTFPFTTDGVGPYTWSIISGSLPNGITLNPATGAISGTASEAGTFPFVVQVVDSNGNVATIACAVVVTGVDTCPGVSGTIFLPFGDFESFANNNPSNIDRVMACQVPFNPADYPGLTGVRFKGTFVKWDTDLFGDPPYTAGPSFRITDENGTEYLPYPAPGFVPNADEPFYLQADIDVVFPYDPVNAHTYYIRQTNDAGAPTDANEWQSFGAGLSVSVVNSDQAKVDAVMLPLFAFSSNNIALNFTDQAAYSVLYDASVQQATYTKIADAQSEISYREPWFIADPFTGAGFGALFKVGGAMVPGTEIAIAAGNGADPVAYSVQIQDDIAGFEPGEYIWQFKRTTATSVYILGNGIRTKIGNAENTLCAVNYETQVKAFVIDCEINYLQRAWKYVASEWTNGERFYFEATWHNGQTVNLVDTGTDAAPIDPPTIVAGSPLAFPGGIAFTTKRSGEITSQLIDGHWYTVTVNPGTTPVTDVTASVIIVRPPTP